MTQESEKYGNDRTTEEEILDKLLPSLYRFALLTLGDNKRAEKAVMNCCIKVYRKCLGHDLGEAEIKRRLFRRLYTMCMLCICRYQVDYILTSCPNASKNDENFYVAIGALTRFERAVILLRLSCNFKSGEMTSICGLPKKLTDKTMMHSVRKLHGVLEIPE